MMPSKILVVEDDLETREMVRALLASEGFIVQSASDGLEGLQRATAEEPDLIITDVTMPQLDGIELTGKLRAQPETRRIPVIVWTSFGDATQLQKAISAGATRAIKKPNDFGALIKIVNEVLGGESDARKLRVTLDV